MTDNLSFDVSVMAGNREAAIGLWVWAKHHQQDLVQTIERHLGEMGPYLGMPVEELNLNVRAYSGLKRMGVNFAGELANLGERELKGVAGSFLEGVSYNIDGVITHLKERLWTYCRLTLRGGTPPEETGDSRD